jgi:hypothetical protein
MKILLIFLGIVLVWAIAGAAAWGGELKTIPEESRVCTGIKTTVSLIMGVTAWPAHELSLEISGKGLGANASSEFNFISLLLFFAWAAVLWSPLLILLKRNLPVQRVLIAQVVLLAVVFALFWKFGNG